MTNRLSDVDEWKNRLDLRVRENGIMPVADIVIGLYDKITDFYLN